VSDSYQSSLKSTTSPKASISRKLIDKEFEKPFEENKEQRLFDFETHSERNPRYS